MNSELKEFNKDYKVNIYGHEFWVKITNDIFYNEGYIGISFNIFKRNMIVKQVVVGYIGRKEKTKSSEFYNWDVLNRRVIDDSNIQNIDFYQEIIKGFRKYFNYIYKEWIVDNEIENKLDRLTTQLQNDIGDSIEVDFNLKEFLDSYFKEDSE